MTLQELIKDYSRKYQVSARELSYKVKELLDKQYEPEKAVIKAMTALGFYDNFAAYIEQLQINSVELGIGAELNTLKVTEKLKKALASPWNSDGMKLSERLHGAEQEMRRKIIDTIKRQQKIGSDWVETARALYDGYGHGQVIKRQEIPDYLKKIAAMARRSELTENEKLELLKQVRKAERLVNNLSDDAPNKALKTAYKQLLNKSLSGNKKALERAVRVAAEEKSRYIAERIARTEAARAYYDGFMAKYQDDESIVAFRWKMSKRHPKTDICDFYAEGNLYNLGAGIYPKNYCPKMPVHPHCLCYLLPITRLQVDTAEQKTRIWNAGQDWLKGLDQQDRVKVLGVQGAKEWKNGADWRGYLKGWETPETEEIRLKDFNFQLANGIINNKGDGKLEQAKKRDHKILITDIAIEKVPYIAIDGFTDEQNKMLQQEHKNVLKIAKEQNDSNEVLSICNSNFSKCIYTMGTEFGVDPNKNMEAVLFIKLAKPLSLKYIHNHPSTNSFSTVDISTFILEDTISTMSVVTNQGEVYVLHKSQKYDYNKVKTLFIGIIQSYNKKNFNGDEVVKRFLKNCQSGGVYYEKG
ncbi:MAG: hypothetical protein ACI3ZR_05820 [bacterium]